MRTFQEKKKPPQRVAYNCWNYKGTAMKLPKYDNRPGPGQPLYSDSSSNSQWDDIKFSFLGVTLTLGTLIGFGAAIVFLLMAAFH